MILTLLITAALATSSISHTSANILKVVAVILGQAWYIILIKLLLLVLLSIILALLLIKKHKNIKINHSSTQIENNEIKENLPPKKIMIKILNALTEHEEVVLQSKEKEFNLSLRQLNRYIFTLCSYEYMKETSYFPTPMGGIAFMYYKILPKGLDFLNEHDRNM